MKKTLFITSLVCALMSLLAILGFSAMTLIPAFPDVETERMVMMLTGAACLAGWLRLAFWARSPKSIALPEWKKRCLVILGVLYSLAVAMFAIG